MSLKCKKTRIFLKKFLIAFIYLFMNYLKYYVLFLQENQRHSCLKAKSFMDFLEHY